MEKLSIKVDENNYFRRLDKFIRKNFPQIKLASIYKLIRKGNVKVNGSKVKNEKFELEIGDLVEIAAHEGAFREEKRKTKPFPMELDILYEDEKLILINKPAGLSIHLGKNVNKPTILEALLFYGEKNNFTPFLVHRLDKHTSGILVIAKSRETARILSSILKNREVEKYYLALVKGVLKGEGKISEPIDGKDALTFYRVIKNYKDATFLEIFKKSYGLKRYFLHSYKIIFKHPFNGKLLSIKSNLPKDLEEVLKKLEKAA